MAKKKSPGPLITCTKLGSTVHDSLLVQLGACHDVVEDDDLVEVEEDAREVGEEEAGDDGDEDHGHLVLGLPPARVAGLLLQLLPLCGRRRLHRGGVGARSHAGLPACV